jgi:tryptophan synthase alpha chain
MRGIQKIDHFFKETKAFAGYLTAGDGGIQHTLEASLALIEGGVNMLEIGVPFSDPIADGPVIQRAAKRALAANTTLEDILTLVKSIRKKSTIPLILFSYLNPVLSVMKTSFFKKAAISGIDGLLLVDCPIEEQGSFYDHCVSHDIAPIYVISPSTSSQRIIKISKHAKGFLYYACRKGTTGVRTDLPVDFVKKIREIKNHTRFPLIAGFGISTPDIAKQVIKYTEGVVVGSLFVKALEDGMSLSKLTRLAASINPLARKI